MPATKSQAARPTAVEHKSFGAPLIEAREDEPGTLRAVVAVFNNVDAGNDRILPGFFAKSLARKLPKGVWGHDWETPIARTLEARELHPGDPDLPPGLSGLGGLYIKAAFNLDTQRGREAYSDIKFGIIDEFSIGYRVIESEVDKKTKVRDLIEGDVFEWSPVLVGMNSRTQLISVKSHEAKADPVPGKAFSARSAEVVQAVGEFVERVEGRAHARFKVGRVLSQANFDSIASVADTLEKTSARLRGILETAKSKRGDEPADDATKADPAPGEAAPADATAPADAVTPPAVPHVPDSPPGPDSPASSPTPTAPDEPDYLATYLATRRAATLALAGSTIPCPTH
jgi:HK97 family phage prohead protease